jgi:hypothetical protein
MAQGERQVAMEMWMGMADKVTLASSARPEHMRSPDFQNGIFVATASMRGCSWA